MKIKYHIVQTGFGCNVTKLGEIEVPTTEPLNETDKMELRCIFGRLNNIHYSLITVVIEIKD